MHCKHCILLLTYGYKSSRRSCSEKRIHDRNWILWFGIYIHLSIFSHTKNNSTSPTPITCCCCCSVFHTFMNDINKHIYTLIRRANKVQCRHQSSCDRRNGIFTRLFLISVTLHSCRSSLVFPIQVVQVLQPSSYRKIVNHA